jgi:hypothetical protein
MIEYYSTLLQARAAPGVLEVYSRLVLQATKAESWSNVYRYMYLMMPLQ